MARRATQRYLHFFYCQEQNANKIHTGKKNPDKYAISRKIKLLLCCVVTCNEWNVFTQFLWVFWQHKLVTAAVYILCYGGLYGLLWRFVLFETVI